MREVNKVKDSFEIILWLSESKTERLRGHSTPNTYNSDVRPFKITSQKQTSGNTHTFFNLMNGSIHKGGYKKD